MVFDRDGNYLFTRARKRVKSKVFGKRFKEAVGHEMEDHKGIVKEIE